MNGLVMNGLAMNGLAMNGLGGLNKSEHGIGLVPFQNGISCGFDKPTRPYGEPLKPAAE
ncbi:hypothetical protein [Rhizobium leguminosarum]|uniref:hypothetical protein n=1 Tax=Rhizobium leguminosarum TaxID=384 RepID=UPI001AEABC6E|nr:hypothetical protein [Rhizobium leguminosarum]MBP2447745.1 hypothetical protein [Rhizobium leguminosarum]